MKNRKTLGVLLVVMGLVMVAAAGGLHLMNQRQDNLAGETADILLKQLRFNDQFGLVLNEPSPSVTPSEPAFEPVQDPEQTVIPPAPETAAEIQSTMPVKTVSGYAMVGILRVSSVGMELPILDNWDYDLLKIAPCRYSGTVMGNNLILMGHNYRSHFKPLYQVKTGDTVEFEDVNGVRYSYMVRQIDTLKGSEGEKLPSNYALSIFTCNPGGQTRLVLRCERTDTAGH